MEDISRPWSIRRMVVSSDRRDKKGFQSHLSILPMQVFLLGASLYPLWHLHSRDPGLFRHI